MSPRIASFLAGDPEPKPCAGADSVVAIYQSMRTADRTIVVALGNDNHWQKSLRSAGPGAARPAAGTEPPTPAVAPIGARSSTRSRRSWRSCLGRALKLLQDVGVPCAPINSCPRWSPTAGRRAPCHRRVRAPRRRGVPRRRRPVATGVRRVGPAARGSRPPCEGSTGARYSRRSGWTTRRIDQLAESGSYGRRDRGRATAAYSTIELNRPHQLNALNSEVLQLVLDDSIEARGVRPEGRLRGRPRVPENGRSAPEPILTRSAACRRRGARVHPRRTPDDGAIATSTVPVIAAVDGSPWEAGSSWCSPATSSSPRTAASSGCPEARIGCMPGFGGTQRLPRRVGKPAAMLLLLTR